MQQRAVDCSAAGMLAVLHDPLEADDGVVLLPTGSRLWSAVGRRRREPPSWLLVLVVLLPVVLLLLLLLAVVMVVTVLMMTFMYTVVRVGTPRRRHTATATTARRHVVVHRSIRATTVHCASDAPSAALYCIRCRAVGAVASAW